MTQRDLSLLQGSMLAKMFAEQMGLSPWDSWHAGAARCIAEDVVAYGLDLTVEIWRARLELVELH
jgi:hypothetical protein